jgi:hypothetical protein
MPDATDLPFRFLRDIFDGADPWVDPEVDDVAHDEQFVAARAAMLDATANVLAAMRELVQSAEDMVRLRRERLIEPDADDAADAASTSAREANGRRRQRIDFTD